MAFIFFFWFRLFACLLIRVDLLLLIFFVYHSLRVCACVCVCSFILFVTFYCYILFAIFKWLLFCNALRFPQTHTHWATASSQAGNTLADMYSQVLIQTFVWRQLFCLHLYCLCCVFMSCEFGVFISLDVLLLVCFLLKFNSHRLGQNLEKRKKKHICIID